MDYETNPTVASDASARSDTGASRQEHTVLLVHGIRTTAEWQETIKSVLEASDPTIRVIPTSYEFFDLFRFLFPIGIFRRRPLKRMTTLVRTEITNPRTNRLSLIGHSFGTWLIAKMLETENDLVFHRIILCGSVIPSSFPWEKYAHRVGADGRAEWPIINECGSRDVWPALAQSVTWGYGASGRFGFGHVDVRDRFHDLAHSGFFAEQFVRDFWVPFLKSGIVTPGLRTRKPGPWFLSVMAFPIKIRWMILVTAVALAVWTGTHLLYSSDQPGSFSETPNSETTPGVTVPTQTGDPVDQLVPSNARADASPVDASPTPANPQHSKADDKSVPVRSDDSECRYLLGEPLTSILNVSPRNGFLSFERRLRRFDEREVNDAWILVLKNYDPDKYSQLRIGLTKSHIGDILDGQDVGHDWRGDVVLGSEQYYKYETFGDGLFNQWEPDPSQADRFVPKTTLRLRPMTANEVARFLERHELQVPDCGQAVPGPSW